MKGDSIVSFLEPSGRDWQMRCRTVGVLSPWPRPKKERAGRDLQPGSNFFLCCGRSYSKAQRSTTWSQGAPGFWCGLEVDFHGGQFPLYVQSSPMYAGLCDDAVSGMHRKMAALDVTNLPALALEEGAKCTHTGRTSAD